MEKEISYHLSLYTVQIIRCTHFTQIYQNVLFGTSTKTIYYRSIYTNIRFEAKLRKATLDIYLLMKIKLTAEFYQKKEIVSKSFDGNI